MRGRRIAPVGAAPPWRDVIGSGGCPADRDDCGGLLPSPPLPETGAPPQPPLLKRRRGWKAGLRPFPRHRYAAPPRGGAPPSGAAPDAGPGFRPSPRSSNAGGAGRRGSAPSCGIDVWLRRVVGLRPWAPGRGCPRRRVGAPPQPPLLERRRGWKAQTPDGGSAASRGIDVRLRRAVKLRPWAPGSRGGVPGIGKGRGGESVDARLSVAWSAGRRVGARLRGRARLVRREEAGASRPRPLTSERAPRQKSRSLSSSMPRSAS
ncbi:hypothetical protein J2Z30_002011 [Streptomyces iranensis]|uniref:Uncharacterized protein n=1 Tax=Streptomyces iranensis TaxID=576784 RepID=A0ABS4MNX1_9ACTN|nr:hypothetical protein [Streptomyces iranensis]